MKIILTEAQASRLVEIEIEDASPGMPRINYSDNIDGNSPEIKRLIGKMNTMYKVLKKGSGEVNISDETLLAMVTYELPPIEDVEFHFYMSRGEGIIYEIFTEPYDSKNQAKFTITNYDEFPEIAKYYTMEEFADKIHPVLFSECVQKRFKNFGIKIW
jgi:hypothetical protein